MHLTKNGFGRLLVLLTLVAPSIAASSPGYSSSQLVKRNPVPPPTVAEPLVLEPKKPVQTKNPAPGTADAPVDGQDGKPHSGPMISKDGPPSGGGTGGLPEIGVSGGVPSVNLDAPPPVTGEHEIFDVEGKAGTGKAAQNDLDLESSLSKSITTEESDEPKDKEHNDHDDHDHDDDDDNNTRGPPVTYKDNPSFSDTQGGGDEGTIDTPMHSFTLSFIMIIFSEIGDKTFLIAALMAMKHSRLLVFSAALCSLIVMSILSAMLGHAVPTLIPKRFTSFMAAGLFLVFGVRMIRDGLAMEKGTASVQEEMKEVEQELEEKEALRRGEDVRNLEEGGSSSHRGMSSAFKRTMSSPNLSDDDDDHHSFKPRRKAHKKAAAGAMSVLEGVQNLAALVLSPAWVQTFVMTFLGEWGDRSQIATIAMAAGQDYWWVTVGSICGHSVCTAGAVIGGRFLAEKISVRNVTLGGAMAFLVFGVLYFLEAMYM